MSLVPKPPGTVEQRWRWLVILVVTLVASAFIAGVFLIGSTSTSPSLPSGVGTYQLLGSVDVGNGSAGVLFDPANGMVYVANELSETVSVVNSTTLQLSSSIYTGHASRNLALDPTDGRLFVANDFGSNVSVIDTATDLVIATLQGLGCVAGSGGCTNTVGVEFSPSSGQLYVLENTAASLVRVDPTNYTVLGTAAIDPNPGGGEGFAIDPESQTIYFPARGTYSLELIGEFNGTTFYHIAMPGPYGPTTSFFDPSNGLVYVMLGGLPTDPAYHTILLNPTTGKIVSSITVSRHPDAYSYDPVRHLLFVSCSGSHNVSVINDTTNQVTATIDLGNGAAPAEVAVDAATGHVFVDESSPGRLLEFGSVLPPTGVSELRAGPLNFGSVVWARWTS